MAFIERLNDLRNAAVHEISPKSKNFNLGRAISYNFGSKNIRTQNYWRDMKRRSNWMILCVAAALCLVELAGSLSAKDRPNILFIFSDDHALRSISSYGGDLANVAPTPNIDRIAAEGMLFQNSFCANSCLLYTSDAADE